MEKATVREGIYWSALKEVMDPEYPISVVDMGLIYNIEEQQGNLQVTMTYTAAGCGCMKWIEGDIEKRLLQEPTVKSVRINVVWDPPWTVDCMSPEAKEKFRSWGVSSR